MSGDHVLFDLIDVFTSGVLKESAGIWYAVIATRMNAACMLQVNAIARGRVSRAGAGSVAGKTLPVDGGYSVFYAGRYPSEPISYLT